MKAPTRERSGRRARRPAEDPGMRVTSLATAEPALHTAKTRTGTRHVSGHFKTEVAKAVRLIAVEQDKDIQEILAEALNLVFAKYGKSVRVAVSSGRRRKAEGG